MVLVSGRRVSLVDWRGFEAHDATKISGAGCWFSGGGGGLRGCVAGAEDYSCGRCRAEDAVSGCGAGTDCDCVVSVPGFHRGERRQQWQREDGVERVWLTPLTDTEFLFPKISLICEIVPAGSFCEANKVSSPFLKSSKL